MRPFLQGQTNGQSTVDYIGENGNIMIANPLKQGKMQEKYSLLTRCLDRISHKVFPIS